MERSVKIIFIFMVLVSSSLSIEAQNAIDASELRLRHDIGALANDSMFGREAGYSSEYKAAKFIEKAFSKCRLTPINKETGSYLKAFDFGDYTYKKAELWINNKQYRTGVDFGAVAGSADIENWSGETAFIEERNGLENLKTNNSYKGKAVVLDMKGNEHNSSPGIWDIVSYIHECIARGAEAILLFNASHNDFGNRLFNADSMPSFPVPVLYITHKVRVDLNNNSGATCKISVEIKRKRPAAHNVIGFMDNGAQKTIMIGGHFDHVGTPGVKDPIAGDPNIHNGADDNASGAAAVLELARWITARKGLRYNYLFIAFSAEEKGLFGSWNFCNSNDFKLFNIAWMLNLDMVGRLGWSGKNRVDVLGLASAREWKKILKKVDHTGLKLTKLGGGAAFSDHYPFRVHKVPFIYFTTGLEHEYHKPVDDPELINYKGEAVILDYIERLIVEAERSPEPEYKKIGLFRDIGTVIKMFILKM
ncbi:MAG: M28 family peptidase [Bacteroidetes bacterium]|nr:M28 family peptidase [Bacteroidota bacterium]